jgi:hypothetical protein
MCEMTTSLIKTKVIVAGHDGGMNVMNGVREYHVIIFSRAHYARFTHVLPRVSEIERSLFIQERFYQPLGVRAQTGEYPPTCFVGPHIRPASSSTDAPFLYSFDSHCSSGALEITGYHGDQSKLRQIGRDLETLLEAFPTAQHISASVLADKERLIRDMRAMGFEITAYLPAWRKVGSCRYDCLRLVKRNFSEEPVAHGMEATIKTFQDGFAPFLGSNE